MAPAGVVTVLLAAMGMLGLAASNGSLRALYEKRMVSVRDLSATEGLILSNRLLVQAALSAIHLQGLQGRSAALAIDRDIATALADATDKNLASTTALWRSYTDKSLTPREAALAGTMALTRQCYLATALPPDVAALRTGDCSAAVLVAGRVTIHIEELKPKLAALGVGSTLGRTRTGRLPGMSRLLIEE